MNFLSHYYFDRHSSDSNQVLGSVLPDLVKNANKLWNLHPDKQIEFYKDSDLLRSIHSGWQRHIFVDNYFHSSEYFSTHTNRLRLAISPVLKHSPVRPFFLAHIALELMLDSLLLKRDLIDPHDFYNHLSSSDRNSLSRYLEINKLEDTQHFLNFLEEFISVNYLHSYRESENVMYALNKICLRIWENPMTKEQRKELTFLLTEYLQELELDFMNIFDEIDSRLNELIPVNRPPKHLSQNQISR